MMASNLGFSGVVASLIRSGADLEVLWPHPGWCVGLFVAAGLVASGCVSFFFVGLVRRFFCQQMWWGTAYVRRVMK